MFDILSTCNQDKFIKRIKLIHYDELLYFLWMNVKFYLRINL